MLKKLSHRRKTAASLRTALTLIGVLAMLWAVSTASRAAGTATDETATDETGVAANGGLAHYGVQYEGDIPPGLTDLLKSVSRLEAYRAEPPATLAGLRHRAQRDMERFATALRSEGYYAGSTRYRLERKRARSIVIVAVDPGPAYRLSAFDIAYEGARAGAEALASSATDFGMALGGPARAPLIVEAEAQYLDRLGEQGHPFAIRLNRDVLVDHAAQTVRVTLTVDPGPAVKLGPVTFEGLTSVKDSYLRKFIPWPPGAPFDRRKVEALRAGLAKTGLFRSVTVLVPDTGAEGEALPVTVRTEKSERRTIEAGGRWGSGEGFGGTASWEHRNFFGRGEIFKVEGEGGEIRQGLDITLRKPNFNRMDQTLRLAAGAERENNNAYEALSSSLSGSVERVFDSDWIAAAGLSAEISKITDSGGKDTFTIVSVPLSLRWDSTHDLLDPHRGMRLDIDVTPQGSIADRSRVFLVSQITASTYMAFWGDRVVAAGRIKLGSIVGAGTASIPATKLFFAGGGGSVRGYGYKLVGPLDALGEPLGGRGLFEVGGELRVKITQTIGLVPFVEGGNVYNGSVPSFTENLRWAAGIGARYYTAVGPIRVDFAFPINRRPGIDNSFEFYISLGQAF